MTYPQFVSMKPLLTLSAFASALISVAPAAEPYPDPAPPKVNVLAAMETPQPAGFARLRQGKAPKPRAPQAKSSDWPRMLGPSDDATSPETALLHPFPLSGLAKVWEIDKGDGYTSPAISGDFCVLFHALAGKETVECVQRETGLQYWSFDYPISYQDRLGYANGPRGSPVISGSYVLTLGVTSMLHCIELSTGRVLWQRDLAAEFLVPQEFFGHGSCPLVVDGKVIINVGGKGVKIDNDVEPRERKKLLATPGLCVGAFDLKTGALVWGVKDEWGASYASPILTTLHGKPRVLVFAGGESDPASGGLLCLDPSDGTVFERFAWRGDMYTSVNATSPVVIPGKNRVFITTAYPKGLPLGGVMLEFDETWKAKAVWKSTKLACHWMNPVYQDGYLYAIDGETEQKSILVCFDADNGTEQWRKEVTWKMPIQGREYNFSILRASLLLVDGECLCLGETGSLHWLHLTPKGVEEQQRTQLWVAPHTWVLPAVSHGLLYVGQHDRDQVDSTAQRFVCYDLRD